MILNDEEKRLIEEEVDLFEKTLESLCEQLPQVRASKISANVAARELTRTITNEWNPEERQPLVSDEAVAHRVLDIRKEADRELMELIREPYFGRVITSEEDGREVAFKIGKQSNLDAGIVDWRNGPISSLYFNYQQGEEFFEVINNRERIGRIKIRRSYKTEGGRLVQIDTPEGVYLLTDQGWEKLDMEKEIAAHRSRGVKSREKRLPSILSLITSDQFKMITSDPDRPVIIQGSAGSGKTTVALHRLAWLLGQENSQARPKGTRVVVMNKSLQVYVAGTLPSMGIEGVETTTFNSWALSIIRHATKGRAVFKFKDLPSFIEEIKFSEGILRALEAFVQNQHQRLDREIVAEFRQIPALLKTWGRGTGKAILPQLRDFIYDVKQYNIPDKEKRSHLEFLNRQLRILEDPIQDIYDLLSDKDLLSFHLESNPKLDSQLDYLEKITSKNRRNSQLDYFDMSLMLRMIQVKNGGLPDKKGGVVELDHLVVDEAQDFGPVEFAVMVRAVRDKRHLTIVGDVAQKIFYSRKFIGWDRIVHHLGLELEDMIHLEVSYRCTAPIMTLARRVSGEPKIMEGRRGPEPEWYAAKNRDDLLETLAQWIQTLQKADSYKLIALICRYPKQAMELREDLNDMVPGGVRLGHRDQFSFEPGVISTNVHQVKGLEFDSVALIEPSEESYPQSQRESRNMLYVAITRAQDELMIIGQRPFSRIFNL